VVGQGFLEFGEGVVSGENGAGTDTAVPGGGDIVFHIADKKGLLGTKIVFLEDPVDGIALVGNPGVGLAKEVVYAKATGLVLEVGFMDGAEKKYGEIAGMAVFKDFAGSGKEGDGVMEFPEDFAKNLLQLLDRGVGNVLLIKSLVGEIELFPKSLAVKGWLAVGGEDAVGGFQDGGEVVDEGAGPVEDQVTYHAM
jgi:hypothetical protein